MGDFAWSFRAGLTRDGLEEVIYTGRRLRLVARASLLVAPGITTSSMKLLVTKGIATTRKDVTGSSWREEVIYSSG